MASYSVVDDTDEQNVQRAKKRRERKVWSPFTAILFVLVIALAGWFTVSLIQKHNYEQEQRASGNYSGEPITEDSSVDFGEIDKTNEEGIKVDEDGFIPVSLDGGPIFVDEIKTEGLTDEEYIDTMCTQADRLKTKRSRENRYALYQFITTHAEKISDPDIKESAQSLTGYDFNNQSIENLIQICR